MDESRTAELGRIGTLGSVLTFAGQATASLRSCRAGLGEPTYFPTMDAVVAAVLDGTIHAGILTSETSRTASTDTVARMLAGDPLFVLDEVVVPYHCALLGKPGTTVADVRHVGGHGSLRQCRDFLQSRLPNATTHMHRLNSVEAAREVLDGDGSIAVIATEALAAEFGLEIIERDVDAGAVGGWWALGAALEIAPDADHIAVLVDGPGALAEALAILDRHGLLLRTITNAPTGEIFRYRYLITARAAAGSIVPAPAVTELGTSVVGVFASTTVS